jgi:hypothetical protein
MWIYECVKKEQKGNEMGNGKQETGNREIGRPRMEINTICHKLCLAGR